MSLPTGTVAFLFTDIEGSTKLWEQHPEVMRTALARHDGLLHQAIAAHDGVVFKTIGDAFCAAFHTAPDALAAALIAQQSLQTEPWPDAVQIQVRMALHTGTADERDGDYFGPPLNRVSRLLSTGHGGQTLLSQPTYELIRDILPLDCSLRDMGIHGLRDLSRPEQVYQLCHPELQSDFPPLKSLDHLPNNLPLQLTSFVGRERELAQIEDLLSKTRLLTLTGSGGCGKTRLSLQTAADVLDQYPDGAWLIELAQITDPDLVPQTVANVLGVKEQPGKTYTQALAEYLKTKTLLLVLDNCEHLLTACAQLSETLLRACPTVKILASSREGLGIAGELTYRVPSLSLPDAKTIQTAESLSQYEAVQLFIERAQFHKPEFSVTNANAPALAFICLRLDGIPLGIELAAARVRSLSVEEINDKLDNRFRLLTGGSKTALPRQQTLRALIDWSYGLLTEPEKLLLRRLSVFVGGWTLMATEAVCVGNDIEEWEMLDLLTGLVDKSLVQAEETSGQTRYRFLETVRQYARDRLAENDESMSVRERHRDYFLHLALEAKPKLTGSEQGHWLSVLETEHDNLRQALTFCLDDTESVEAGLRLGAALLRFWQTRGHISEGRERLAALLARSDGQAATKARAAALNSAGILAYDQGDYAIARSFYEATVPIWQQFRDQGSIADFLMNMGNVAYAQSDYAAAQRWFEESLAIKQEFGDKPGIAAALHNLGGIAQAQGDYTNALTRYEESLTIRRELGDRRNIAHSLNNLGRLSATQGDYRAARQSYTESLTIRQELEDRQGIAQCLGDLGQVSIMQGDYKAARSLYEESLMVFQEMRNKYSIANTLNSLGAIAYYQGDHATARAYLADSLTIWRELGNRASIASSLGNLGGLAQDKGDYASARVYHEESLALGRELGDRKNIAHSLNSLGMIAYYQGDYETARSLYRESLAQYREIGIREGVANCLIDQGKVVFDQGDYTDAWSLQRESLAMSREMGDQRKIAFCLEAFAALAVPEGNGERAARLFGAAEVLREVIGAPLSPTERPWCDRQVEAARAIMSDEVFTAAWAEGRAMTMEQAVDYALEDQGTPQPF